jgi:hypothetical protein
VLYLFSRRDNHNSEFHWCSPVDINATAGNSFWYFTIKDVMTGLISSNDAAIYELQRSVTFINCAILDMLYQQKHPIMQIVSVGAAQTSMQAY